MSDGYREYRATTSIHVGEAGQLAKNEIVLVGKYDVKFGEHTLSIRSFLGAINAGWIVPVQEEVVVAPSRVAKAEAFAQAKAAVVSAVRLPPKWGELKHWRQKVSLIKKSVVDQDLLQNIIKTETLPAIVKAAEEKLLEIQSPPVVEEEECSGEEMFSAGDTEEQLI